MITQVFLLFLFDLLLSDPEFHVGLSLGGEPSPVPDHAGHRHDQRELDLKPSLKAFT